MRNIDDGRYVDLDGTFNFRDIGGYKTKDGRMVKYGKHYRSDELSKISSADIMKLQTIGIKTIIDYRGESERIHNEDVIIPGATIHYLDPVADIAALASSEVGEKITPHDMLRISSELAEHLMTDQNRAFVRSERSKFAFRKMFNLMLQTENHAIVQHCRGGKDRTGYGVALIHLILGVSREDVMKDYMLTNYYKHEKNEKSLAQLYEQTKNKDVVRAVRFFKEAQPSFLETALDIIDQEFGGIDAYVHHELGLLKSEIERLKDFYLE